MPGVDHAFDVKLIGPHTFSIAAYLIRGVGFSRQRVGAKNTMA
jgi:hypothetical protein